MKTAIAITLVAVTLTTTITAQNNEATLAARKEKKLASEFLARADWNLDLRATKTAAARTDRLIFAYFSRSYAPCPPCIRFEQSELLSAEFAAFAQDVVLFFHNTSGLAGDDDELLARVGGRNWPALFILDQQGQVVARHKGERTSANFKRLLDQAADNSNRLVELRQAQESGSGRAAASLLVLELDLGRVAPLAAYVRLARVTNLPAERRLELFAKIVKHEVGAIQITATNDHASQVAAGERFATMIREDRIPAAKDALFFWYFAAVYAEEAKDAVLMNRAVAGLEPHSARVGTARAKWVKLLERWQQGTPTSVRKN